MNNHTKIYDYRDESNSLLYQVVRLPGNKFQQRRPGGNSDWIYNLNGVRRIPYRLVEIIKNPETTVYVTQGEKDADTLDGHGLVATTNSGGAEKWRDEYSKYFKGRSVVITHNNNPEGLEHARQVARSLLKYAGSIRIIELPGLAEGEDITDWFKKGNTLHSFHQIVEETPEWDPKIANKGEKAVGQQGEKEPYSALLIKHIEDSGIELFHDDRGEPYAKILINSKYEIFPVNLSRFRLWLNRTAYILFGKPLNSDALCSIRDTLAGKACFDGPEHELHVRHAWHDDAAWIDIGGGRAIRVSPGQWEIVDNPPKLFRWFPHMKALPEPIRGGDPWRVLHYLNISDPDHQNLIMCYIPAVMIAGVPVPALAFQGPKGAAKTSALRVVKNLIDPSSGLVRGGLSNLEDFSLIAWQNRALFFDNMRQLPDWLSDALCRAITGEGSQKRTLYKDEETTIFEYLRVIGLSGVNLVVEEPDLLDRTVIITLAKIPRSKMRPEREFWGEFKSELPSILGGFLDILAQALLIRPSIELPCLPRMADFALNASAVAEALGIGSDAFLRSFDKNAQSQNEVAIEASLVAQAVIEFMQGKDKWEGTQSELLGLLTEELTKLKTDPKSKGWPKDASRLGKKLKEIESNLEEVGIKIVWERTSSGRIIKIKRLDCIVIEEEQLELDLDDSI